MNIFKLIFIKARKLVGKVLTETYDDRNYARKQKTKSKWENYLSETGFDESCKEYLENMMNQYGEKPDSGK